MLLVQHQGLRPTLDRDLWREERALAVGIVKARRLVQGDLAPAHPYRYKAGLIEVPRVSEYTWLLEPGDLERQYNLLHRDYERVRETSGVFVALSHYYAMTGPYATGLRVYERAFARARELGDVRFCTAGQLLSRPGDGTDRTANLAHEEDKNE
jgi:hypothetical protein